jgi:hypothetical protein
MVCIAISIVSLSVVDSLICLAPLQMECLIEPITAAIPASPFRSCNGWFTLSDPRQYVASLMNSDIYVDIAGAGDLGSAGRAG